MRIILCSVDDPLAAAWSRHCGKLDNVAIHRGNILDLEVDVVVSPANSFGFMDGGIDAVYSQFFGWDLQTDLQQQIKDFHHGELLVGAAEIVETGHSQIPYLIAAPTMRVPMVLTETVNPYLAARAVLRLVTYGRFSTGTLQGEKISDAVRTVAIPGLGTGVGKVSPDQCAMQVSQAIKEICFHEFRFPNSWVEAQIRHQKMVTDQVRDLQL